MVLDQPTEMSPDSNGLSHEFHNVALYIDGISKSTGRKLHVINPVDDRVLWTYSSADVDQVDQAVASANAAFETWATTNPRLRSEVLLQAAVLFLQRREELERAMKLETAADDAFIGFNIQATVKHLKDVANRAIAIEGTFPFLEDDGRSAIVLKEPYGVVLGIAPW